MLFSIPSVNLKKPCLYPIHNIIIEKMNQEDFAATASERQRIWTFRTINMSRENVFPFNQKHGIEENTPIIQELVLMNKYTELRYWIARHPEDIEIAYRQKNTNSGSYQT